MDEAIDFMKRKQVVSEGRSISLTFDNGFKEIYHEVFPLSLEYNFPLTVLISPLKVDKDDNSPKDQDKYLTWNNLKELSHHRVTIGAFDDASLNVNNIPENIFKNHIIEFKKMLEDKLGFEIKYFGVKEGIPNKRLRELIISEGYKAFLTECPTYRKADLYSIGRIQVDDDDFNIFLTKISRTYLFFKDRRSWKYIRKYRLDKVFHHLSEAFDRLRGIK